jgi:hypothetical protein
MWYVTSSLEMDSPGVNKRQTGHNVIAGGETR